MILEFGREVGTADYEVPSVQVAFEIETGCNYLGPKYGWIREEVRNDSWGTPLSRVWKDEG